MNRTHPIVAALLFAVLVTLARGAAAQTRPNAAAAEALYNEARKLMDAGKFTEACPKLEESNRLDPGMGTQFFLAECYAKSGRTASAWALYREVETAAKTAGRKDRQDYAKKLADALEPKIIRMKVEVPWADKVSGVEVRRSDGKTDEIVGHGQFGMAVPVDPGRYTIKVSAPGKQPSELRADALEPGATTEVVVPELADVPRLRVEPPQVVTVDRGRGMRVAGFITAGVGVAAMGASVIMGAVAKGRYDSTTADCDTTGACRTLDAVRARDDAQAIAGAGTVTFFVGAAAVLAGAALVVFAPKATSQLAHVTPVVAPGYGGLALGGRF